MSLLYNKDDGEFPYEIRSLDPEQDAQLKADFPVPYDGFVQVGPQKWFFPKKYAKDAKNYYNLEFRKDDVVVLTYPRSGTTLTQEMVWLICNEFNFEKAAEQRLNDRFRFMEYNMVSTGAGNQEKNNDPEWKKIAESTDTRFIKTHFPFTLLSPSLMQVGCKIIYVARNPKDVAVSFFHLLKMFGGREEKPDIGKFWDFFSNDLATWCPFWEHVKEGWERKDEDNVLFMFYEDMIKDLKGTIQKVASFLEKPCTEDEIEQLANHLNIDNFKKNKSVNLEHRQDIAVNNEVSFIRKGKAGGWRDHFDEEWEKRANEWIEDKFKNTDITFPQ